MTDPLRVLSLGAGVQSSTLLMMSNWGELPKLDGAIFADTGNEPASVYKWLDWLERESGTPIYKVKAKTSLSEATLAPPRVSKKTGNLWAKSLIPAYTKHENGSKGMLMRQCTRDYKIIPIQRKLKELSGRGKKKVEQWIGISLDEVHRMKPSQIDWIEHQWPLIWKLKWSRQDCLNWWDEKGFPRPPRSACVFCPYHSDFEWLRLKNEEPEEFQKAVEYEAKFRSVQMQALDGEPFLHSSLVPLDEVSFREENKNQLNLFINDCTGMCGV